MLPALSVAVTVKVLVPVELVSMGLDLPPGGSAEIAVAYFDGTELQPWPEPQRYTRLEANDGSGVYRFLSLDGGFTADLPVDSDGLVLDYPGLFRRTFP